MSLTFSAEMQSVYSTAPADRATSVRGLTFSAEMQSVYSTAPADRATSVSGLTPMQRCSRCILLPLPIGLR